MTGSNKTLHIKTFGCQMNVYDSERMADALAPEGYSETDTIGQADVIVLNTCHIREKAAEKVYSELGRIRQIKEERKEQGKDTVIAVAGCVAQAEGEEILKRAPVVDLVIGPQSYQRLPELVAKSKNEKARLVETEFPEEDKFKSLPKRQIKRAPTAFLTVQEGCDKFCTFCVVPYTRGVEFSRPVSEIVTEARKLAEDGVREITLLGQNVNAYHGEGPDGNSWSLAGLLEELAKIEGLDRLRFTTSHPRDMADDLIHAIGNLEKLMPYLHLPFQAGSDRILKAMNRKHTQADYFEIIARIRAARPDLALSTDIIVGFPGETDEDFEETMKVVEHINFAQAYSFKYSARPGTPASDLGGQVDEAVKTERLHRLQDLLNKQQHEFNLSCVGKRFPVLLEKKGRHEGKLVGRSPYLQPVHVEADENLIGQILDVEISQAGPNSLQGVIKPYSESDIAERVVV